MPNRLTKPNQKISARVRFQIRIRRFDYKQRFACVYLPIACVLALTAAIVIVQHGDSKLWALPALVLFIALAELVETEWQKGGVDLA